MTLDLAANTAVSFTTTTTWQAYAGESTLRYLAQVIGLVAQNFLAGAAGLAAGFAFIRGLARDRSGGIGNFWVDLVRSLLWVLLPLSLIGSLVLIWQGVPLNLEPYTVVHTLEGRTQIIAQGPVAALEFIKPEDRSNPVIYPPSDVMNKLEFVRDLGPRNAWYDELWTSIKSK